MSPGRPRRTWLLAGTAAVAAGVVGVVVYRAVFGYAVPEAAELRAHVRGKPPVPVVFTSRANLQSFAAAAPEADGFTYPGTIPWAATEGRLRVLSPAGRVYELTWNRPLPDGSTLVDVMSPSVSLDGKTILFAGRKAAPDPGRWRLYQVNADGSGLKPLTGGADDPGCVAVPPLRFAADGSKLPDDDRRRLDYDDVDPADGGDGVLVFASSRIPDLGRDHTRRATQIWRRTKAGDFEPVSANRNNDRWPVLVNGDWILWSLWSRNRESVTADGTDVRPVSEGGDYGTTAADGWMGARVGSDGSRFGFLVKPIESVWRPRPLFNGNVAFMTTDPDTGRTRLAQAAPGTIRTAPSSRAVGPSVGMSSGVTFGPTAAGCPSPCPPGHVLYAAGPDAAAVGLWRASDDWGNPEPLFDDPALADAEPVAVYARAIELTRRYPSSAQPPAGTELKLLNGKTYRGPMGQLEGAFLNILNEPAPPGDVTDAGHGPVFANPTGVKAIAIYAAYRDRFDDPKEPRVRGGWEKLLVAPVDHMEHVKTWVPADPLAPTVLTGLGADGKVVRWAAAAKDAAGRSGSYYAYAGDHYSGMKPNGSVFCNGCHAGHTFTAIDPAERVR